MTFTSKKTSVVFVSLGVVSLLLTVYFYNTVSALTQTGSIILTVGFFIVGGFAALISRMGSNNAVSVVPTANISTQAQTAEAENPKISDETVKENLRSLETARATVNATIAKLSDASKHLCSKSCSGGNTEKLGFCNQLQSELVNCGNLLNSLSRANWLNKEYVAGLVAQANIVQTRVNIITAQISNRLINDSTNTQ